MSYYKSLNFKSYIIKDGTVYIYDGKNITYDISHGEIDCARWIIETFGGKIYILPKINVPNGIKTADYLYNNEYWDLKRVFTNGKRIIDNRLNNTRKQASNYIIDISKSSMSNRTAISQIKNIYNSKNRSWIQKIILKGKNKKIYIFQKKGMPPALRPRIIPLHIIYNSFYYMSILLYCYESESSDKYKPLYI